MWHCHCGCGESVAKKGGYLRGHSPQSCRPSRLGPGQRHGQLTILAQLERRREPSGHQRLWFLVRCDCGAERETCGTYILRGATRCAQCSWRARRSAQPGDRFDRLVVKGYVMTAKRQMVECACDCGNTTLVRATSLFANATNNCGCSVRGGWRGAGELSGAHFHHIMHGAKIRGLEFSVTIQGLWDLYVGQGGRCALTGLPIKFVTRRDRSPETTASCDRIDSNKGYVMGNVQWVHKDVNLMKMSMPEDRFVEMCSLVADFASKRRAA